MRFADQMKLRMAWLQKWVVRLSIAGLLLNVALIALPARFKPYRIHREADDYGKQFVLVTTERGFGPSGIVWGRYATVYEDRIGRHLDPMRREWERTKATPPTARIDTRWLMWDNWGPSCTNTPQGVGVASQGDYFCVPYLSLIILFSVPVACWGIGRMIGVVRKFKTEQVGAAVIG